MAIFTEKRRVQRANEACSWNQMPHNQAPEHCQSKAKQQNEPKRSRQSSLICEGGAFHGRSKEEEEYGVVLDSKPVELVASSLEEMLKINKLFDALL